MNYFEFYELPVLFHVNETEVKKKFYELSKKYHPDFFANESEARQQEILELSTLNNKAYQVLSHPLKRIEYILGLNNLMAEGDKYQLPQDFLMDMMDVNEALMEQEFEPDAAALDSISRQVDEIEKKLFDELKVNTESFDREPLEQHENTLLKIKDIWYRQKYLLRIRESLHKFATRI
ncbi:Fe-S protein assembly co-chaperone HscB [Daejeonella oryzae]|uniref:Fe-S protein assembly co-chaperone HscB n=1 Tax=Daejeonella oryzae TaxID=1122943 RepID=UPI00040DCA39|nr:Fe-S protein assembly co-chaperone HscB [Daejeonella oryzae]